MVAVASAVVAVVAAVVVAAAVDFGPVGTFDSALDLVAGLAAAVADLATFESVVAVDMGQRVVVVLLQMGQPKVAL